MGNTRKCLDALNISQEEAEEIIGQPLQDLEDVFDIDQITFDAIEQNIQHIALRRRQAKLQAVAMKRTVDWVASQKDPEKALEAILSSRADTKGLVSVERHQQAVLGSFHSQLSDMMEKYRVKKLGFSKDKQGPRNLVRELFGQATGDADASKFAKMWKEVAEQARARFNKAGGDVQQLTSWNLPQSHDTVRVGKAGFDDWFNQVEPLLDKQAVFRSLGVEADTKTYRAAMKEIYEFIASDGLSGLDPEKALFAGASKMANRHQESRLLHFKNGDAWLKYQDSFGLYDDPSVSMNNYLFTLAREIGMMERMGPNPSHTFNYLQNVVRRRTNKKQKGIFAEKLFKNLAGQMYAKDTVMAGAAATVRSAQVTLKLGSAMISALSDTYFQAMTARYNGISMVKQLGRFMSNLNPTNKTDRQFATRMGFIADYAMDRAHATYRYADIAGHGMMATLADATVRASGLNHWTQAGKTAFALEFMGALGDQVGTKWDSLSKPYKRLFEKYGVTDVEWKQMSKAKLADHEGATFFDPRAVNDEMLRNKIVGMAMEEMTYAVPEANARTRTWINQGLSTGDLPGEIIRTMMQFKTFPITIMTTHMARGMAQEGILPKLGYMASLMTGTTILGAAAYNAKEMSKGRTPIAWDEPALWRAGFIQGDSTGILGDFFVRDMGDMRFSPGKTILGPTFGDIEEFGFKFLVGSMQDVLEQEKSLRQTKGAMGAYMVKKFTPGQLWYTRLAMDRYMFDRLNKLADPNWARKQRANHRKRVREQGNKYWWKPGQNKPETMR